MSYLPDIYQHSSAPFRTSTSPTRSWRRPATRAVLSMLAAPVSSSSGWRSAQAEGAVRSHVRRALAENITPEEVHHVGLLALTTLAFPHTVAGLGWIDELIASKD
jgi:alkylhydroperoxidase/carboxymuconolactone decarboxylase family protein YurZ